MKKKWITIIILSSFALINLPIIIGINVNTISGGEYLGFRERIQMRMSLNAGDLFTWNIESQFDFQLDIWDLVSDNPIEVFRVPTGVFLIKWSSDYYIITIRINSEYMGDEYIHYSFKIIPLVLLLGANFSIGIIFIITFSIAKRIRKRRFKENEAKKLGN